LEKKEAPGNRLVHNFRHSAKESEGLRREGNEKDIVPGHVSHRHKDEQTKGGKKMGNR